MGEGGGIYRADPSTKQLQSGPLHSLLYSLGKAF
jgi:hypothetical protein